MKGSGKVNRRLLRKAAGALGARWLIGVRPLKRKKVYLTTFLDRKWRVQRRVVKFCPKRDEAKTEFIAMKRFYEEAYFNEDFKAVEPLSYYTLNGCGVIVYSFLPMASIKRVLIKGSVASEKLLYKLGHRLAKGLAVLHRVGVDKAGEGKGFPNRIDMRAFYLSIAKGLRRSVEDIGAAIGAKTKLLFENASKFLLDTFNGADEVLSFVGSNHGAMQVNNIFYSFKKQPDGRGYDAVPVFIDISNRRNTETVKDVVEFLASLEVLIERYLGFVSERRVNVLRKGFLDGYYESAGLRYSEGFSKAAAVMYCLIDAVGWYGRRQGKGKAGDSRTSSRPSWDWRKGVAVPWENIKQRVRRDRAIRVIRRVLGGK